MYSKQEGCFQQRNACWFRLKSFKVILHVFLLSTIGSVTVAATTGNQDPCQHLIPDTIKQLGADALLGAIKEETGADNPLLECYIKRYQDLYFSSDINKYNYFNTRLSMYLYDGRYQEARSFLKEFKAFAEGAKSGEYLGRYWFAQANYHLMTNQLDSAEVTYRTAAALFEEAGDVRRLYLVYGNLSTVYLNSKKYDAAYQYLQLSQNLSQQYEGLVSEEKGAIVLNNIGVTYLRRGLYEQADSVFQEAGKLALTVDADYPVLLSLLNRMEVATKREQWEETISLKEEADAYIFKYKSVYSWYAAPLVKAYLGLSNFARAKDMIDSLNDQEQQQGLPHSITYYTLQARYHLELADGGAVLSFVNQALGRSDLTLDDRIDLVRYKIKAHLLLEESAQAQVEIATLEALYGRLQKEKQKRRQEEMAAIYELESHKSARDRAEKLAADMQERATLLERNRIYLATALLSAIGGLIVLFLLLRSNRKRTLQVKIQAEEALKHSEQLDKQLRAQRQNALQSSIGAAQLKNNALNAIARYESNLPLLKRKLSILIHDYTEKSDFVELFLVSYPDFFKGLSDMAPDLTKTQLRYAILVALGASTTEIASTQGVTEKAVNMAKYRLKTKLELDTDENLERYLRQLLLQ
jgi:DNA-binding CsgD family transcriptional regulator